VYARMYTVRSPAVFAVCSTINSSSAVVLKQVLCRLVHKNTIVASH
jgi:hypothetical protein